MSVTTEEIFERVRQHPRLVIVEDYELAVLAESGRRWNYDGGELRREEAEARTWVSLRLLNRKQPGRAVMAMESPESVTQLVETAFESSRLASADPWFRFPIWKSGATPSAPVEVPLFSPLGTEPGLKESYGCRDEELRIVRKSERTSMRHARRIHSLTFRSPDGWWEHRAESRPLRARERWLSALVERSRTGSNATRFDGNTREILFRPAAVVPVLAHVAPWFLGDRILDGKSPLSLPNRRTLFAPCLSLVDDGTLEGGSETQPFDLEGCATQQTVLVDCGIYRQVLVDTYSGTRENRISTGNFLREPGALQPRLRPSHFFVRPGADALPASHLVLEMVDTIEVVGGHLELRGRGIFRGVPVRGIRLRCSIIDLLSRAVGIGNDLNFFGAWGSPSIFFSDLPISN